MDSFEIPYNFQEIGNKINLICEIFNIPYQLYVTQKVPNVFLLDKEKPRGFQYNGMPGDWFSRTFALLNNSGPMPFPKYH